ncbi:zinc finger C2HC domain-containing protein 1C isoform X2 [Sitophilus oryzae]|uniref:Zinc finger C2HC domain-containing protein 1C isoform X2 n=1 Tax=Sitophilus oryzae TaxID=7048 RepID=A0A6J2YUN2_SITOR|nr:zinc finger C2HC domain-containing protein 1C isoform X2 [Sitophilus oryzae]
MTSRLAQMQARFQQKQMQEKEEKLLKLYESQQQRAFERVGRGSAGSNSSTTSIGSTGGGKVRQMFDERRQKAGVDKSYPLEPLKNKTPARGTNLDRTSRTTVVKSTTKKTVSSQIRNGKPTVNQTESVHRVYNNNYKNGSYEESKTVEESFDTVDGHNNLIDMMNRQNLNGNLDNEEMPQIGFDEEKPLYFKGKLANVGGKLPSQMTETRPITNGVTQRNSPNKQETKVTPKKPTAKAPITPQRTSSSNSNHSSSSTRSTETNMSSKPTPSSASRAPTNNRPSARQTPKSPVVRDDLAECRYCGRRFATDRIGTHEDICGKSGKKKRKAYDATKHRVQGTELEPYVKPVGSKKGPNKVTAKSSANKKDWRRTHEEFIAAIRAAKQAQAYVAKGGKLADLPPPPPSSNPDYVQCPHCGRKFNEAAAARHIPKCANFEFNKPKGGAAQKGRPGKR